MKKVFVVLLILAIAGGVFAQELTWNGYLNTGIQFSASDAKENFAKGNGTDAPEAKEGTRDLGVTLYGDDAGVPIGRFDLTANFTYGNAGAKANLRADSFGAPNASIALSNAYGWVNFLDGKLNLKAGLIDDGVWGGGGDQDFGISTGLGVRFEITPIEGLNFGVFFTGPETHNDQYTFGVAPEASVGKPTPVGDFLTETAIGASYSSDLFAASLGLKLDSDDASAYIAGGDFADPGNVQSLIRETSGGLGAYIGFAYKGVDPLTAKIEAALNHLGEFGGNPVPYKAEDKPKLKYDNGHKYYDGVEGFGSVWINETIGYQITDKLEAGLVAHQFIFAGVVDLPDGATDDQKKAANSAFQPELRFTPHVGYSITDAITVGLQGTVALKANYYDLKLDIKPKASFKFGDNATFNANYNLGITDLSKYATSASGIAAAFANPPTTFEDPKSVTSHTVQFDFIWSF